MTLSDFLKKSVVYPGRWKSQKIFFLKKQVPIIVVAVAVQ